MTLTKTMAILLVLLLLPLSIIGCTAKEDKESSGEGIIGTEDGAGTEESVGLTSNYTNPMLEEIEDILFNQLQPMPDLNQGEKIGALVITLTNPFWVDMKNGYEQAARELGVNLEVMAAPTENDAKSQLETLDAMVAKDFKALIISPIEPFNLVPGVVRANERGIPVINLGPHIDIDAVREAGGTIDGRILVDFEEQGALAAQYIVHKLGANGGEVAIIQGIPGAGQSEGRTAGARKVFDRSENVKVVSVQPANWDR
ncbi:MAG: substrate-binding domain-containing protein, partial [Candidatus Alkaliphilus sp. MAG34]